MINKLKELLCQYQLLIIKRDNFRSGRIYLSTQEKILLLNDIDNKSEEILDFLLKNINHIEQIKLFE